MRKHAMPLLHQRTIHIPAVDLRIYSWLEYYNIWKPHSTACLYFVYVNGNSLNNSIFRYLRKALVPISKDLRFAGKFRNV